MPKKIKVVVLHNVVSPHIEPVFKEIAKEVDLTVLYCSQKEDNRSWDKIPTGFKYKILPGFSAKIKGKDLFTYFVNPGILSELKALSPEVVIISGWDLFSYQMAALYCKKNKIKLILWSGSTDNEKSWRRSLSQPLVKAIISQANAFIAYGTKAKDYLINLGAKADDIFISFNTTDLEGYKKLIEQYRKDSQKIKKQLELEDKKVALFYGQLIDRKGVDVLIKAFKITKEKNEQASLLIIGSGKNKQKLESLIKNLNLKDAFILDDPGDKEICKYYAIADLLVLPSTEEVWGLVINQALAGSVPVIATDKVGSSVDLINNGSNGFIVPAGDIHELSEKMGLLLGNETLRNKMVAEASKRVLSFYPEKTAGAVIEAIKKVMR